MSFPRRRSSLLVAGAIAVLAAAALVSDLTGDEPARSVDRTAIEPISERVEALRGLEFNELPGVEVVTTEQLEEEARRITRETRGEGSQSAGDRRQRRELRRRRNRATNDLLRLAGLVPPDFDRGAAADELVADIGGVYDPTTDRMLLIDDPDDALGSFEAEVTLAHELTHALDDQRLSRPDPSDPLEAAEASGAEDAVAEGTATLVHTLYVRSRFGIDRPIGELLETQARAVVEQAGGELSPALRRFIAFPYVQGAEFVRELRSRGGWALVNEAHERPPTSTEQVLHPSKWEREELAQRIAPPPAESVPGWRRVGGGEVGEFDLRVLLAEGAPEQDAEEAAAGWDGGRFDVWRRPGECEQPCRSRRAAVVSLAWDTGADARQWAGAVPSYLTGALGARPAGGLAWWVGDGAAAAVTTGERSGLAFAPSTELALRLAAQAAKQR